MEANGCWRRLRNGRRSSDEGSEVMMEEVGFDGSEGSVDGESVSFGERVGMLLKD